MLACNGAASRAYKRQRFWLALTAIAIPKRIRHRRLCPVECRAIDKYEHNFVELNHE